MVIANEILAFRQFIIPLQEKQQHFSPECVKCLALQLGFPLKEEHPDEGCLMWVDFLRSFIGQEKKKVNFNDISLRWLEFILIINSNSTTLPLQVQNIFYLEEKVQTHIHTNPNNPPQYNLEGQIKTVYKVICSMRKCLQNITTSFLVFRNKQYNCFKYMLILLFHIKLHVTDTNVTGQTLQEIFCKIR